MTAEGQARSLNRLVTLNLSHMACLQRPIDWPWHGPSRPGRD